MPVLVAQSGPVHLCSESPQEEGRRHFDEQWNLIERIVAATCKHFRLRQQDAEDFRSTVLLRFVENDFELLRGFRHECQWSTFLTTVIRHMGRDFLIQNSGRWRFSERAKNLGLEAMWLESLWLRDGFDLNEAIEYILRHRITRRSRQDLVTLAADLPQRTPRRFVGEDQLQKLEAPKSGKMCFEKEESRAIAKRVAQLLRQALAALDHDEQRLLCMQYYEGLSLTEIATRLDVRRRSIYTLRARCLRRLRRFLENHGLRCEDINPILGKPEGQIAIDFSVLAAETNHEEKMQACCVV